MKSLILGVYRLLLLSVISCQIGDIRIQVSHLLIELSDVDVLFVKFFTERLDLLVLRLHLLCQIVDDLLQLSALHSTLTHLLLQLVDELLVLLHGSLDELHILLDAHHRVCSFTLLGKCHTTLSLSNLTESLLDITQGGHHVVDLIVFLGNNLFE